MSKKKNGIRRFLPPELLGATATQLTPPALLREISGLHRELIRLSRAVLIAGASPLRKTPKRRAGRTAAPKPAPTTGAAPVAASPAADPEPEQVPAPDVPAEPVRGYAQLGRRRRIGFLKRCTDEELVALRAHEAATGNRAAALLQIDRELVARERAARARGRAAA